ncbi:uncharacterized protein LOC126834412 isoform X2 [Adelges cooleyi]|nr:uncharacterized protein LOC126834412 isoform X2 [Adelges cooleyi]
MLWDSINDGFDDYIFYSDFLRNGTDEEMSDLVEVLKKYGSPLKASKGEVQYKMNFNDFKTAVYEGHIARWHNKAMLAEFKEMIPDNVNRDYVITEDMNKHYGFIMSASKINAIIKKYGKLHDGEHRLEFSDFKIALNRSLLPELPSDKIAAMYTAFKALSSPNDFIIHNDLVRVYGGRIPEATLKNIVNKYGRVYCVVLEKNQGNDKCALKQQRLYFEDYKNALNSGGLAVLNDENKKQMSYPMVNPIGLEELELLWEALSLNNDYFTYYDLIATYGDDNPAELMAVMEQYGLIYENNKGEGEYRMYFEDFLRAINNGHIHRWSYEVMNRIFTGIIPKHKHRRYIINYDMVKHYGNNKPHYLEEIIRNYQEMNNGQYQLPFNSYRKAMDIGHFPKPKYYHTIGELYGVFRDMIPGQDITICNLGSSDLIKYYGTRIPATKIETVVQQFGKWDVDQHKLSFSDIRRAWDSGELPRPLTGENEIWEEIETLFIAISGNDGYINYYDFSRNYEEEDMNDLKSVLETYGFPDENSEGGDELRMDLDDFRKAASEGRIPRWHRLEINTVFAEIAMDENKKYVTYSDMAKYYGTSIPAIILVNIIKSYGNLDDGEYRLDILNLTTLLNIGYLPELLSDKIATIYEMFEDMIPEEEERVFVTKDDLTKCYGTKLSETQIENIMKPYEKPNYGEKRMYFCDFKKALIEGELPKPSFVERGILA